MRPARLAFALALGLFTLASLTANATTYYVATNGSDTNNGTTLTTPYATINKAASVVNPGDTVYVRGGVYYQTVSISRDGSSTARILFTSYTGETAVIDGSNSATGAVLVSFYDANYVDFTKFEVANSKDVGISLWNSKNCTLKNNVVRGALKSGIYVGADLVGNNYDNEVSDNRVYNNVMVNAGHTTGGTALAVSKSHRIKVLRNTVYENHGNGIGYSSGGTDGVIADNKVYDNYNNNIHISNTDNTRVERNFAYGNGNTTYYDNGLPPHGIGMGGTLNNVKVLNNIVVRARWGIYFYDSAGRLSGSTIAHNTVNNTTNSMLSLGTSTAGHLNNVVASNIFHQPGTGSMATVNGTGFTFSRNNWYPATPPTAAVGTGDVNVSPLLTNPNGLTALDYKLLSTSPCIDTGSSTAVTDDHWGTTRSGSFDIGAHEYGTGTGSPKIWYVSTTGSDSNPGTITHPFRNIEKADTVVLPGDVVNVRGGTYMLTARLLIKAKGTSTAPITFRSHPNETAILDGTNVSGVNEMLMLSHTNWVDFMGFEIRNSATICLTGWGVTNTRIMNNKIHGCVRNGITVTYDSWGVSSNVTISGNEVYDTVRENMGPNSPFPNGGWGQSIGVGKTVGATIVDNVVHENWGEGIVFSGDTGYIGRNKTYDNFSVGIYLERARYSTVDRNLVYNTNDSRFYRYNDVSHGIFMANENDTTNTRELTDNKMTNNIVINTRYGIGYVDIESGGGMPNTLIANNTVYKASLTALRIEDDDHTGSVIENNIFYQPNAAPVAQVWGTGVTYRTNSWYGSTAPTAAQHTGDVITDPVLVNPGTYVATDYKLQSTSPCKTTGTANSVTVDYWGTGRTTGWSIGAHEYN